jgi:hypothetical protein
MEFTTFLATQAWLQPPPDTQKDVQASSKRPRCTSFSCKGSFHLSLQEQQGKPQQWLGAKAADAVFIRLQHSGGVVTSTMNASLAIVPQQDAKEQESGQQGSSQVEIKWCGSSTTINTAHVIKVSTSLYMIMVSCDGKKLHHLHCTLQSWCETWQV